MGKHRVGNMEPAGHQVSDEKSKSKEQEQPVIAVKEEENLDYVDIDQKKGQEILLETVSDDYDEQHDNTQLMENESIIFSPNDENASPTNIHRS